VWRSASGRQTPFEHDPVDIDPAASGLKSGIQHPAVRIDEETNG
jgi:hypothetical protein